jgi:hypothetical protein
MVTVIFTLDYELHGNGEGCAFELMVEPTARLLRQFDQFGAKLTIMADVAEILKFKEYAAARGKDDYHYQDIVAQLQGAVRGGHDVQLHLHSSYFNASHDGTRWVQDWSEYDFAGLEPHRMQHMIRLGKDFLESIIRPVAPAYRCTVFRAANWSVSPSKNVVQALLKNQIYIETSVFKFGRREGLVNFDYTEAASDMLPWRADDDALWRQNPKGSLWEVPIYSENRRLGAFLSANRIYRFLSGRLHRIPRSFHGSGTNGTRPSTRRRLSGLAGKHAWKADFNQCTGRQLIGALKRGASRHGDFNGPLPFVLIGHSKLFTSWNERSLRPFLASVAKDSFRFTFGTFGSLDLPASGEAVDRPRPTTGAAVSSQISPVAAPPAAPRKERAGESRSFFYQCS